MPFNPESLVTLQNIQTVLPGKIAPGKTEIMNGVQQVGFAHAIPSADPGNAFGKAEFLLEIIFELKNRYVIQEQGQMSVIWKRISFDRQVDKSSNIE